MPSHPANTTIRRFQTTDRMPAYQMFRDVIWDLMQEQGIASAEDSYDLDQYFAQQKDFYIHLELNASEDWVAEDSDGQLIGWARSIERDEHLQLTHFFVRTGTQGTGVGRALLDKAFPIGRGNHRSIIATTHPKALSLYLRYGVYFQGMAFTIYGQPQNRVIETDLTMEVAEASATTLASVLEIDKRILGYDRSTELEFFMKTQPTYLFRREGQIVAYAFGYSPTSTGPAAALARDDMLYVLQYIEQGAFQSGAEELWLLLPAQSHESVSWALNNGYQIDPFHEFLLSSNSDMKLDRYLISQSSFTW